MLRSCSIMWSSSVMRRYKGSGGSPGHVKILLNHVELICHASHHHHVLGHLRLGRSHHHHHLSRRRHHGASHHGWGHPWSTSHALHGAALLEPSVPHLDLTEQVAGVGGLIGVHGGHVGARHHHGGALGGGGHHHGLHHSGHRLHGRHLGLGDPLVPGTDGLVLGIPLWPHRLQGGVTLEARIVAKRLQRHRGLEGGLRSSVIAEVLVGPDALDHLAPWELDVGHPLVTESDAGSFQVGPPGHGVLLLVGGVVVLPHGALHPVHGAHLLIS